MRDGRRENRRLLLGIRGTSGTLNTDTVFFLISMCTHTCISFYLSTLAFAKRYRRPARMLRLDEIRDNACQLHCYVTAISLLFRPHCIRVYIAMHFRLLFQKSLSSSITLNLIFISFSLSLLTALYSRFIVKCGLFLVLFFNLFIRLQYNIL